MSETPTVSLNGRPVALPDDPGTPLVDVLRDDLGDRSVRTGCRNGDCGTCTVLVDGDPVKSCLLPNHRVAGREVTTLRGLSPSSDLHPVAQAFWDTNGFQCGYCLPGMVLCTTALLADDAAPDRAAIEDALTGNLCRCTGYQNIVRAVEHAAHQQRQHALPAEPDEQAQAR
jgi:aerobic-type carbon monoxide dehydrogenase small subunit (CoxS/CutS family)